MLWSWFTKLQKARFYLMTREILETAPMPVIDAPWSIVSMVSNSDVQMYLLGLKSFYTHLKRGKIIAIVDRDMPSASRVLMKRHFPGIQFVLLDDINTGICQRGGTWERILYLLDRSRDEYTIQLDCDTLTCGPDISDVLACVESNTAFTLGHNMGYGIAPLPNAAELARQSRGNYVGLEAERMFDRYPNAPKWKYVRASSAFAGFAKNGISRQAIEDFHQHMETLLGTRWTEWGTEQCASNFAVANSPNAIVLRRPKYANFSPGSEPEKASFLHFYGTYRYMDDFYAKRGREVIESLKGCRSDCPKG